MRLPAHLRPGGENGILRQMLRRRANAERGLLGVPIYLCGSALLDFNTKPRDWDIRIRLSDREFSRRYADGRKDGVSAWITEAQTGEWTAIRWRWSDDCVKRSKDWSRHCMGLNFDVQIYPATHWKALYRHSPRLRLDTRATPT